MKQLAIRVAIVCVFNILIVVGMVSALGEDTYWQNLANNLVWLAVILAVIPWVLMVLALLAFAFMVALEYIYALYKWRKFGGKFNDWLD